MNEQAHEKLTDARKMAQIAADELRSLSFHLDRVGMVQLSDSINDIAHRVQGVVTAIHDGTFEAIRHSAQVSEEATANMVRAVIANACQIRETAP